MTKTLKVIATGLVLGNYWGGGHGIYAMTVLEADSKEELLKLANEGLKDGSLDDGMGFESLRGAMLDITLKTSITYEDEEYINEKYQFDSVGTLTVEEYDILERTLLGL